MTRAELDVILGRLDEGDIDAGEGAPGFPDRAGDPGYPGFLGRKARWPVIPSGPVSRAHPEGTKAC